MEISNATETPAARAIRLLGLIDLAHRCRLTTDAVRKWPNSKGGYIPAPHQRRVMDLAKEKGVTLTADDIIGGDPA